MISIYKAGAKKGKSGGTRKNTSLRALFWVKEGGKRNDKKRTCKNVTKP